MPMEQFSQHLLPSLLSLSSDPVANVRVLVAKALRQSVMEKGRKQTNSIICVVCNIFVIANKSIEKTKTNSFCFFSVGFAYNKNNQNIARLIPIHIIIPFSLLHTSHTILLLGFYFSQLNHVFCVQLTSRSLAVPTLTS